jgi:hypothetical protein
MRLNDQKMLNIKLNNQIVIKVYRLCRKRPSIKPYFDSKDIFLERGLRTNLLEHGVTNKKEYSNL